MRLPHHFWRSFSTLTFKPKRMASRGALIVVEGCDRCGKTTQCNKLIDVLQTEKIDVQFKRFPDRTTRIGKMISEYLQETSELDDHAVHLLFSANRWESVSEMKKLLYDGTSLIVDRYAYSGVAFTSAKPGFDINWCKQTDVGLPKPDLVMYLTLSEESAAMRGDYGNERYEKRDIQRKVKQNFELLKEKDWEVIDADRSVEEIHEDMKALVLRTIKQIDSDKISTLWTK